MQVKATREAYKISNCYKGMCVFEFYNATNTFPKVWITCILGGFRMYLSKVALAINLKKNEKRKVQMKKRTPFSFHHHVYHGFYSCCSDTWVLIIKVIPYNLLNISDS